MKFTACLGLMPMTLIMNLLAMGAGTIITKLVDLAVTLRLRLRLRICGLRRDYGITDYLRCYYVRSFENLFICGIAALRYCGSAVTDLRLRNRYVVFP